MTKWSGRGIPPTRKKLHRWRMKQELERTEELRYRLDLEKELDDSARKSGVNSMLVEN